MISSFKIWLFKGFGVFIGFYGGLVGVAQKNKIINYCSKKSKIWRKEKKKGDFFTNKHFSLWRNHFPKLEVCHCQYFLPIRIIKVFQLKTETLKSLNEKSICIQIRGKKKKSLSEIRTIFMSFSLRHLPKLL